jgi:hypothetical protein
VGKKGIKYSIDLSFEEVQLPPFQDILVVGKNSPQGKIGLSKSLELLSPGGFEIIEVKETDVEVVIISKKILKKIPSKQILKLLSKKVFPYVASGELLKVDLKLNFSYDTFKKKRE